MSAMVPTKPVEGLEDEIRSLLDAVSDRGLHIATAESCTGGLLSSFITDVDGFSHVFDRGFVTYSSKSKTDQLGIASDLIDREGAVSRRVALAMAEGALARSDADIALSITGFAGPAGDDNEEGLVHFACARDGRETLHEERHFGAIGRDPIRAEAMKVAIAMMRDML